MSGSVNKIILVGNIGSDPEIRYMTSGIPVANASLATNEVWRDKTSGERRENTEWHRVVFFNRLAEIVKDYIKKGSKIYVEGILRTRKWKDKSGEDRYITEIIARELRLLDSKGSNENSNNNELKRNDSIKEKKQEYLNNFHDDEIPF